MIVLAARGRGEIAFVRDVLPGAAIDSLALLTWLGSIGFLVVTSALLYWFVTREGGAFAFAAAVGGFATTTTLKAAFGLPRPPESLWVIAASGFGFPSGHAVASTVGWGALALVVTWGTRRSRLAVAATVVALVGFSRVALGVHYAVDVIAGVCVGVVYLGGLIGLGTAARAFGVATVVAVAGVALTGGGSDAAIVAGVAAGGWLGWTQLPIPDEPWRREGVVPAIGGSVAVGTLVLVGYTAQVVWPIDVVIGLAAGVGVLGIPAVTELAEKWTGGDGNGDGYAVWRSRFF